MVKTSKLIGLENEHEHEHLLAHERLHVFQAALDLLEIADELKKLLPRQRGRLGDHLERSSESVVLSTAEGIGRISPRDRAHSFAVARGSACEVSAIIEICRRRRIGKHEQLLKARHLILRIVQMLSKLSRLP